MNKVSYDAIPYEVKQKAKWVCWHWTTKDGKPTKVPVNPHQPSFDGTPNRAKTDTQATWSSYAKAVEALEQNDWIDGIGFVFTLGAIPQETISGIDLDDCVNPETGEIAQWARQHVETFDTYSEISPSGTGIKMLVFGQCESRKTKVPCGREAYSSGRFFTVTGNRVPNTSPRIEYRQAQLDEFVNNPDWFPNKMKRELVVAEPGTCGNGLADDVVIEKATAKNQKFAKLFAGDMSEYKDDHSSADQALCNILAFWTNKDAEAIDRIFQRSRLHREKWERRDYKDRTIANAIGSIEEGYVPEPVLSLDDIIGTAAVAPAPAVTIREGFGNLKDDPEWTTYLFKGKHANPKNVSPADRKKRAATIADIIQLIPCQGFVTDFIKAYLPTTDGNPIFGVGTALAVLSTIVNRKAWISEGGKEVFPLMWVLDIGASAERKSTWAKYGIKLLMSCCENLLLPSNTTQAALCRRIGEEVEGDAARLKMDMALRPKRDERGAGLLFFDEFASLLKTVQQTHNGDFKEMLTSSFEGLPYFEKTTTTQGSYLIHKPYLPILACSTPEWINSHLAESDVLGGFLGRFTPFISFESDYRLVNPDNPDVEAVSRCRNEIDRIRGVQQEYTLSQGADDVICEWAKPLKGNDRTQSFVNRFVNSAKKISLLYQLSQDNSSVISVEAAVTATKLLSYLFDSLTRFCEFNLASSVEDADVNKAKKIIKAAGTIQHRVFLKNSHFTAKRAKEIIATLDEMRTIRVLGEDTKTKTQTYYEWIG